MFKLEPNPTFWSPVRITVLGQDAPGEFEIEWRHKTLNEAAAWMKSAAGRRDDDLLAEVIAGWRGVSVEFSRESLQQLLQNHGAAAEELFRAYPAALTESRAKN